MVFLGEVVRTRNASATASADALPMGPGPGGDDSGACQPSMPAVVSRLCPKKKCLPLSHPTIRSVSFCGFSLVLPNCMVHLLFICPVFGAAGDICEEFVRDIRDDHADGVRLAAAGMRTALSGW